jgi:cell division septation protein DedD
MSISSEQHRDEREEASESAGTPRSTSRDLDAIAARLASARANDATSTPPSDDAHRARDAARIRTLMSRGPGEQRAEHRAEHRAEMPPLDDADVSSPATLVDAPVETAAPLPLQFPRPDEIADLALPIEAPRPRRAARGVAVAVTVGVGLVIALGAYAGGAEYLSDLITGRRIEAPATSVAAMPERLVLTDSALAAEDSIAYAEQLATFGENPGDTIRRAPFGTAAFTTQRPRLVDARRDSSLPVARTGTKVAAISRDSARTSSRTGAGRIASASAAPPRDTIRARSTAVRPKGAYVVQVRATPDRAEADRLASRLRAKGAGGVTVTTSTKDGRTLYRVRYGAFSTADDAKAAARRDGHSDAWVTPR